MSRTARIVLFEENQRVTLGAASLKPCGPRELVVETLYSTVSAGTELRMLTGHYGTAGKFPFVPGYTSIGRVIAVGEQAGAWRVGDLVSARNCEPFDGVDCLYGAHASHQVLTCDGTQKPVLLPDGAAPLDYVFTEIAAISLRGVEAAAARPGETAVVIGQGLIGALSTAWLAAHGCRVIVVDFEPSRLERALGNGAAYAVSPAEPDFLERILILCNGGADIVVEASGTSGGVDAAFKLLRKKPQNYANEYTVEPILFYGANWPRLIFQANYLEPLPWKPDGCLPGEAAVIIAPRDRGVEERQRVIEHTRTGRFRAANFIGNVYPWTEAPQAYADLRERRVFSAVFDWTCAH
jgi:3-hydroxyethyl bacteriochlorophyllide a dehydrogenase